jgi:uncharacterized protein YndB with AHSA1/START domain
MTATLTVATPNDTEIVMTRTFDAPRELVYEAMTNPEHIQRWWGWSHWTMPVCEADFRPGGSYRFVGRGPEGQEVPFKGTCLEAVRPERLVYTEIFDVEPFNQGEPSVVTTTFEEVDGKTTVTVVSRYSDKNVRDAVLQSGMETGAAHSYDRLADLLTTLR